MLPARRLAHVGVVVAILAVGSRISAVEPDSSSRWTGTSRAGTAVAFVADSVTGTPVLRGLAWITGTDSVLGPHGPTWRTETDSLGWARFRGLPAGAYILGAGGFFHGGQTIRVQVVAGTFDTLRFLLHGGPAVIYQGGEIHYKACRRGEVKFQFDGIASDTVKTIKKARRQ